MTSTTSTSDLPADLTEAWHGASILTWLGHGWAPLGSSVVCFAFETLEPAAVLERARRWALAELEARPRTDLSRTDWRELAAALAAAELVLVLAPVRASR